MADFINLTLCHLVYLKMLVPLLKQDSRDCKTALAYNIEMDLGRKQKYIEEKGVVHNLITCVNSSIEQR